VFFLNALPADSTIKMKDFIKKNNLEIVTLKHREIYLSDARKTEPAKLKTVLRYRVKPKE
jgi:hypothetical protein